MKGCEKQSKQEDLNICTLKFIYSEKAIKYMNYDYSLKLFLWCIIFWNGLEAKNSLENKKSKFKVALENGLEDAFKLVKKSPKQTIQIWKKNHTIFVFATLSNWHNFFFLFFH